MGHYEHEDIKARKIAQQLFEDKKSEFELLSQKEKISFLFEKIYELLQRN